MRRNSHFVLTIAGFASAVLLAVAGGLLLWGSAYVHNTVQNQLAAAYADHFIAQHLTDMSGGKTYSQLSAESMAQPTNAKLSGLVATVFKGETLRSMLLNAYGWWKVSQITFISSLIAFGLAGLAFLASLAGLTLGHRPEITHEAIPATGGSIRAA